MAGAAQLAAQLVVDAAAEAQPAEEAQPPVAVAAVPSEEVVEGVREGPAVWGPEDAVEADRRAPADSAATAGEAELLAVGAAAIPFRGSPMG